MKKLKRWKPVLIGVFVLVGLLCLSASLSYAAEDNAAAFTEFGDFIWEILKSSIKKILVGVCVILMAFNLAKGRLAETFYCGLALAVLAFAPKFMTFFGG